jgi:hypothetical protein
VAELQAGVVAGHDERGLAPVPELRVDRRDHHGDVGDTAIGDEGLGAVQDPVVTVALRGGAQRLHVGARRGLGHGVGPDLGVVLAADHLWNPAADLLRCAGRGDARGAQSGGRDGERDAGAPPVDLLGVDDTLEAFRVGLQGLDPVQSGQLPLVGLLHHVIGDALVTIVLRGSGSYHLARELPAVLLPFEGVLAESKVHPFRLQS